MVLAIAGLESPLIAVAAVGFPLLFQLYVIEVGPYGDDVVLPTFVTLVVGAALGVGWAQIGGPYVQRDLLPTLQSSLTSHGAFSAAVLVPAVGQLLMCVPVVMLLVRRRSTEALDGFVIGAAGALGFTAAATISNLSSQFSGGILAHQPFEDVISQALIRGVSVPLVAAFATGLFGATVWVRRRSEVAPTSASGVWLTSPIGASGCRSAGSDRPRVHGHRATLTTRGRSGPSGGGRRVDGLCALRASPRAAPRAPRLRRRADRGLAPAVATWCRRCRSVPSAGWRRTPCPGHTEIENSHGWTSGPILRLQDPRTCEHARSSGACHATRLAHSEAVTGSTASRGRAGPATRTRTRPVREFAPRAGCRTAMCWPV